MSPLDHYRGGTSEGHGHEDHGPLRQAGHVLSQSRHPVHGAVLLDIVRAEGVSLFQLLTPEDQPLLARRAAKRVSVAAMAPSGPLAGEPVMARAIRVSDDVSETGFMDIGQLILDDPAAPLVLSAACVAGLMMGVARFRLGLSGEHD